LSRITAPKGGYGHINSGAGGLVQRVNLPDGAYMQNTLDASGRLTETSLRNSGGTILSKHGYSYNPAYQQTTQTRTDNSTLTYTYDDENQLTVVNNPGAYRTEYVYDGRGRMRQRTEKAIGSGPYH